MMSGDADLRVLLRQWNHCRSLDPGLLARCENQVRGIEDRTTRAARLIGVHSVAVLAALKNGSVQQAIERSKELRDLAKQLPPGDDQAEAKLRSWQVRRWVGVGPPHEDALNVEEGRLSPAVWVQYRLALVTQLELEDPHQAIRETADIAIAAADAEVPQWIQTQAIADLLCRARRWGGLRADEVRRDLSLRGPIPLDALEELELDERCPCSMPLVPFVLYGRAHRALNDLTDALAEASPLKRERGYFGLCELTPHVLATRSAREIGRLLDVLGEGRGPSLKEIHRARRALLRAGPFRLVGLVGSHAYQET